MEIARGHFIGSGKGGPEQLFKYKHLYNLFQRPSPCRAVNTLRLGYTNESVNAV